MFDLLLVVNLNCRLVLIAVVCVRCLDLWLLWLLYRLYVLSFVVAECCFGRGLRLLVC